MSWLKNLFSKKETTESQEIPDFPDYEYDLDKTEKTITLKKISLSTAKHDERPPFHLSDTQKVKLSKVKTNNAE